MKKNINNELKKRILFLDGTMGTIIMQYQMDEEDFRCEKFKYHTKELKWNN